jgi:hypothetical protein
MTRESIVRQVSITGYALQGAWLITTDYFVDDAVTNGGETYVCIQDHTAAAGNEPGVGGSWTDYWTLIDFIASEAFGFYPYIEGFLHMPSTWTAANISFLVSDTVDGTYVPLYSPGGTLVALIGPAVDSIYVLPSELAGSTFVKLWSNTAGANEAQGGDRNFLLDLKS